MKINIQSNHEFPPINYSVLNADFCGSYQEKKKVLKGYRTQEKNSGWRDSEKILMFAACYV